MKRKEIYRMMGTKEEQDIREIVEVLEKLDPLSRLLVQNSVKTLLTRDQIERQQKKQKA
jgi:hypothetical protein